MNFEQFLEKEIPVNQRKLFNERIDKLRTALSEVATKLPEEPEFYELEQICLSALRKDDLKSGKTEG